MIKSTEEFIQKNDNKGTFIYNTNYQEAIQQTVQYIETLLDKIDNKNGKVVITDKNVFRDTSISYYIKDNLSNLLTKETIIKPKDYIINKLNNEIMNSKKKWPV